MTYSFVKSERVLIEGHFTPATIVIENGKISSIEDLNFPVTSAHSKTKIHDFGKKTLIPGLVDTHVHINEPGRAHWEGFATASQAAAAGGITTVVDMPLNCNPVTTTADALNQKLASLEEKLWIDCGFWGGVVPDNLDDLDDLLKAGVLGFKSFTIHSGLDEFPRVEEKHVRQAIQKLAKSDVPYLIHAELEDERDSTASLSGDQNVRYVDFLASRPRAWENNAIEMMISLAEEARLGSSEVHIHIVHLSSSDALDMINAAKKSGLRISTETCPHYLTLNAESIPDFNPLFKCTPPIREAANNDNLWWGLGEGIIDFIVSDHSPCTPELKHLDTGNFLHAWGGISSLQFGLPLIWTEAKKRGYSLQQVIDWMAYQPAKFAGLGASKGKIAVGYDADLVVFDERLTSRISAETIKFRNKITPYLGRDITGSVEQTFLRGNLIYDLGIFSHKAQGQPILRDVV